MKKFGLYLTGLFLSFFCLTSCLKGTNVEEGWIVGVLKFNSAFSLIIKTSSMGDLYAPNITSIFNNGDIDIDDCFLLYYRLDLDQPENASNIVEANGYLTVTILEIAKMPKYYLNSGPTDTSTSLPNEIPVEKGYISGEYVDKYLVLSHEVYQPAEMELDWHISSSVVMPTEENEKRYYDLYIRATVKKESESTFKTIIPYWNAYYIYNFIPTAASLEKAILGSNYNESLSKFTIRFFYVSSINEETNEITWKNEQVENFVVWYLEDY